MAIKYYPDITQGTEEWHALRCGMLTASEIKLIITPTLKVASNDKERAHLFELLAQRITHYVEPHYVSDDMQRGKDDEIYARMAYAEKYAPLDSVGFVTNDKWGFTLGCSPDDLVGEDGIIEAKSRRQKYQIEVLTSLKVPEEHILQVQAELLVTERAWCDYISYSGGLPMLTLRVYPDEKIHEAIVNAASEFEKRLSEKMSNYGAALSDPANRLIPTERRIEQEIVI